MIQHFDSIWFSFISISLLFICFCEYYLLNERKFFESIQYLALLDISKTYKILNLNLKLGKFDAVIVAYFSGGFCGQHSSNRWSALLIEFQWNFQKSALLLITLMTLFFVFRSESVFEMWNISPFERRTLIEMSEFLGIIILG